MGQRFLFVVLVALVASACQKQASGQTVAVVNNEEITAAELNDALRNDANLAGSNSKEARSQELQKLIARKLLVQQAKADGLDKSPDFINQQRRAIDDLLINTLVAKRLSTAQVPTADDINKFQASHPETFAGREIWTLDQIIYPLPQSAAVGAQLSAAKTLDQVAQALTSAGVQFKRDTKKVDTAVFPHAIYTQVANVKDGEPFIVPGPDKAIANVITTREPAPIAGNEARTVALNGIRREQADKVIQDRVKSLKSSAKIEYQPGFAPAGK
jgi:peptidyl-prolyl cis-trans isomerase C